MASIDQVAAHLNLSARTVDRLISKGVLPRAAPGEHDLQECTRHYIQHERAQAVRRVLELRPDAVAIFEDLLDTIRRGGPVPILP
ncbi:hypothetical protein C5L14_16680 [Labrys okinawensis]|uniref:Uncharacterized protein n=1 Tax=Labrys okinawensis TaxID=346911 RepID=A0A2S9QC50_9HYPH|nr:DNA-binding protein [Labrys okinawensis]PRH86921.1 hypothetical protein C5L14_16680 [Labrys okinawensis]